MSDTKPPFPNPFSPEFVPQLKLGRQIQLKRPQLDDRHRFFRDSISDNEEGKQFRMNKASI